MMVNRIISVLILSYTGIPEFPEHSFEWNYSSYRSKKRISILWDMENCGIPKGVRPEDVSINILASLEHQTEIKWDVNSIAAYADFSKFSKKVRYGCQITGVKLIDIPNVKEGAADRALIVALFEYAVFCPPPSSIMLVTGDVDFVNALRQRGHDIYLVIPSGVRVSASLTNASNYVWDWSDVVRGKIILPTSSFEIKEHQMLIEEELFESARVLLSFDDVMPVQLGDLTVLRNELVKLLESSGGCLRLVCLASEYQKRFKKPFRASDYKALKLVDLLEKMSDVLSIEGRGGDKVVLLSN